MLRPYQQESVDAINREWMEGREHTLLCLPTGTGKTVVFSEIAKQTSEKNNKTLILAHRHELLKQAQDKIKTFTGLDSALEKAEYHALESDELITVASIQTLINESRLNQFPSDYFQTIIIDEAHHVMSDSYQKVLKHFTNCNVLGCTATPKRSDRKELGQYFDSLAYEYTLPQAIKDGYLVPLKAMTIPLKIDVSSVKQSQGDYQLGDLGNALEPYLEQIADEMVEICKDKHTVVFLPLIETSKKFCHLLNERGLKAAEVSGNTPNREQILNDFEDGKYQVLCNAMLLCLDQETQVLTNKGFVGMDEITYEHEVANWNFDGTVYFEKPKEIVKRQLALDEHMVSIDSKTINFKVTNTHKMIVQSGDSNNHHWKKISADELKRNVLPACGLANPLSFEIKQEDHSYTKANIRAAVYNIIHRECLSREDAKKEAIRRLERKKNLRYKNPNELTLDECKLIGFWIADGTVNNLSKGGKEYVLCQSKTYPNIIDWIDTVLTNTNIDYIKRLRKKSKTANNDYYTWHIPRGTGGGSQERNGIYHLEPYLNKNGSEFFWGLDEKQFDALLEGIWYGDGFHHQAANGFPKSVRITNTNHNLIELLCTIGSLRKWKCHVSTIPTKNKKHNTQYGIKMIKNGKIHISSKTKINKEAYSPDTTVWCVRTSSKNIITRRNGYVTVMGNTEGWDCPTADCVVNLRPTKVNSLYQQIIGRITRPAENKEYGLILDFLWQTQKHDLCRPAVLIAKDEEVAKKITEKLEDGEAKDLIEIEEIAVRDVLEERENKLAEELRKQRNKKKRLVDPLQFAYSIMDEDLTSYEPEFGYQTKPATEKQLRTLENFGINSDAVQNLGHASMLLDKCIRRNELGLSTAKQIRKLESYGFQHVGEWTKEQASKMMSIIAANHWMLPPNINPREYKP